MARRLPSELNHLIMSYLPVKQLQRIENETVLRQYLINNAHIVKVFYNCYFLPDLAEIPIVLNINEYAKAQRLISVYFTYFITGNDNDLDPNNDRIKFGAMLTPNQAFTKICSVCGRVGYQAQFFILAEVALIYAIRQQDEELVLYYLTKLTTSLHIETMIREAVLTENKNICALVVAHFYYKYHITDLSTIVDPRFLHFIQTHEIFDLTPISFAAAEDPIGILRSLNIDLFQRYLRTREFPPFEYLDMGTRFFTQKELVNVKDLYQYVENNFDPSVDKNNYLLLLDILLGRDLDEEQ